MKIKTKLNVVMWFSAVVVVINAGFLFLEMEKGNQEWEEAVIADRIEGEMGEFQQLASGYFLHGGEKRKTQLRKKYEDIAPLLQRERFAYPEEREAVDKIRETYEGLGPVLNRLIAAREKAESGTEGRFGPRDKDAGLLDRFIDKSQEVHNGACSLAQTIRSELMESHERVHFLIVVLSAVMAAVLIVSSILLSKMITTPLARLKEGVEVVGTGNLLHKVGTGAKDEIGGLSRAFDRMTDNLRMITASRDELEREMRERLLVEVELRKTAGELAVSNEELRKTLSEVKTLHGILPICSNCRKIRDDKGDWEHLESYVTTHTGTLLSHGMCPKCMKELYPEFGEDPDKKKSS